MTKHNYLKANGIRLYYVSRGEGPLLLFLHGFPQHWYCWRHQIEEFSKKHHVVALDLRGYNLSDKPNHKSAYQMKELVQDIHDAILALGHERCILVGHDWGGAIAWNFIEHFPKMIDKLIVLNMPHPAKLSKAFRSNPIQLLKSWYMFAFQLPWLPELLLSSDNHRLLVNGMKQTACSSSAFSKEDIKIYQEAWNQPGALTAMLNYYRNIFRLHDLSRKWHIIEKPVLMIWGEKDHALQKELTLDTDQYAKNFRIHSLPKASHWVQEDQPEPVNQIITDFLNEVL